MVHHAELTAGEPRAYYTRDLVEGAPISAAPSLQALRGWAESLLRVLGFLHAQDVLHRDLKPDNVLLSTAGTNRVPMLIDFGLSGTDRRAGTVAYAAPELLRGAPPSVGTDLYALGATLLELASGEPPVDPANPEAAIKEILTGALQARVGHLVRTPRALVVLMQTLLSPEPSERPASAREALTRLTGKAEEELDTGVATEPPFLGRDELLAELCREPDDATPDRRFIQLIGEGGSGKTRLLSELRWRLQLERRPVVQVSCRTGAQHGTLQVFIDAARRLLPGGVAPRLESQSRQTQFEALWQVLKKVAEPQGLWLLVDDTQESDADGREWLHFLGRAAQDGRITTIAVARPQGALDQLPTTHHQLLDPLGAADARQILTHLTGHLPERVRDRVLDLARGNAALLTHLGRRLRGLGPSVADVEDLSSLKLPTSLLEAEVQRLTAALDAAPWPVLERLAVCSEGVDRALLVDDSDEEAQLARMIESGVASCHDEGCSRLDPLEPLTRDAALAAAGRGRLNALHRDWIRRLTATGASTVHIAHHRIHAGPDGAGLSEVLAAARELRAQGATGRATHYLAWCVNTAAQTGTPPDIQARHTVELAELLLDSGRLAEGLQRLRSLDVDQLSGQLGIECALTRAQIQERQGQLDAAEQTLAPLMARSSLTRAQASRLAAAAGDARAEAVAVSHLALASHSQGELAEAEGLHRRSLQLAEAAGLQADLPGFTLNLATALQERGRLGEALALFRRAAGLARRLGRDATLANALANYGNLMIELGAHAEAQRTLTDAQRRAQNVGLPLVQSMTRLYLAEVAWRQGRLEEGLRGSVQAAEELGELGVTLRRMQALLTAVEVALDADRPREVEAWLEELRQARDSDAAQLAGRLHLLEGRLIARDPAHHAEAEARFDAAARWAQEHGDRSLVAAAAFGRARLRLGQGDIAGARNHAEAALATQRAVEQDVPSELRERFWLDPRRATVAALLEQMAAPAPSAPGSGRRDPAGAPDATPHFLRILRFNRELLAERATPRLLERVMDTAVELTGAERGFLLLRGVSPKLDPNLDPELEQKLEQKLRVEVARNIDRETIRRGGMKFSRSLAQEVAETGTPILTVSAQDDARLQLFASVSELRLKSVLSVPIRTPDRILGTLYLDNRFVRGRFTEHDMELLQAFADQVAVVLVNARLTDELETRGRELENARAELELLARHQAAELVEAREALAHARRDLKHEYPDIIGRSPAMRRVLELVDRVVDHDVPVLIGGESGTGKELLARTLHSHGPRRLRSFVAINCGALPEPLLESELFGHVKGAFTGADRDHDGLFRVADGGTLLLDEVGEMSPAMQSKLLRVLQEREIRPVGSSRDLAVDVRILAATNRDLAELVESGAFRQDLYYRINVIPLVLPPLRERPEDLPTLANFFAGRAAERMGLRGRRLTKAALRRLLTHSWPGNVRELENVISNALLMADGETVGPGDLTLIQTPAPRLHGSRKLADLERDAVEAALRETGGNRTRAAELLGISRVTLQRRLKKWRQGN